MLFVTSKIYAKRSTSRAYLFSFSSSHCLSFYFPQLESEVLFVSVAGLHTETLTIENIDELMCSMTSYSTDILERNILETFKLGNDILQSDKYCLEHCSRATNHRFAGSFFFLRQSFFFSNEI